MDFVDLIISAYEFWTIDLFLGLLSLMGLIWAFSRMEEHENTQRAIRIAKKVNQSLERD